jgi:hypothetical protein
MDYYQHFKNEEASDFPLYRGNINQRGHGLGNWFRSFFRFIVPILKKHAEPVLKKVRQLSVRKRLELQLM